MTDLERYGRHAEWCDVKFLHHHCDVCKRTIAGDYPRLEIKARLVLGSVPLDDVQIDICRECVEKNPRLKDLVDLDIEGVGLPDVDEVSHA